MANEMVRVGRLSLIKSRPEHAEAIADDLRLHDLRECLIHELQPLEALTEPFATEGAETYTVMLDKQPIAMCGTVPNGNNGASVWLLGTHGITNNFRPFLRGCSETIELLQDGYEYIENYVPVDHHATIMWLSWCGFSFDKVLYEVNGHTMMRFVRCTEKQNNVMGDYTRPVMH